MTGQLIAALALLIMPAILPSVALLGSRPITIFMTPLVGSVLAAIAAELEIVLGSSLLTWYVVLFALANALAMVRLGRAYRWRGVSDETGVHVPAEGGGDGRPAVRLRPSGWSCITVAVMTLAVLWPLQALRAPIVTWDAYAIWTLHSQFIYGGHDVFRAGLTNPVYGFSNPNYPPLVPASGALGFVANGMVNLRIAVILTSLLNASALASLGCAVTATLGAHGRTLARITALVAGASLCLIGFGLSGVNGVGGEADLLWSAAAAAAIVIGFILPRSGSNLLAAWVCATVAGLTKNEGLVAALLIFVLLVVRYVPTPQSEMPREIATSRTNVARDGWLGWGMRVAALAVAMSLPSVSWSLYAKYAGIRSDFVGPSGQLLSYRFHATAAAVFDNLHVAPLAIGVAVIGAVFLRTTRQRLGVGNDLWLWLIVIGSLGALVATYVFGALEIHYWLSSSAGRTTIFENLALYCDMALWLVVAFSADAAELPFGLPELSRGSDRRLEVLNHSSPERA